MPPREPTSMLRAALQPRMLVILVLLLAAAAVCARLGVWQLERAQLRGEMADRQEAAAAQGEAPRPLDEVLAPQTTFSGELLGRAVSVEGTYEPDGQLLVTDRALDGRDGLLVLTPLRVAAAGSAPDAEGAEGTADGGAEGAAPVLAVVRGWVESPDDVGEVPSGPVELTGYLQAAEGAGGLDAAGGRAEAISTAQLVNVWGGPIYSGYLVLATSQPSQDAGLEPLGPPQPRGGSGWDLRNLGYALQWWIFGLFAVALWLRLVRDEARGELPPGEEVPDGIVAGGSSGAGSSGEGPSGEGVADPDVAGEDAGRDRSVRGPADADASA